jgi:hypothetical protein
LRLATKLVVREAMQDPIPNNKMVEPENAVRRECAARTPRPRHAWFSFLCGCVLALIFMELVLHHVSGKTESSAGFEERDFREGFAKAHFTSDGLRRTGNPQIAGARRVLILGDSHVEAYSVADEQTMGSVLERRLRAEGKEWNVLQYGWSGADGPDYVYEAGLVKNRFHPNWIILVTNKGDFGSSTTAYARLVERDGAVFGEPAEPGIVPGRPPSRGGTLSRKMKESGLLYASAMRFYLEVLPHLIGQGTEEPKSDLPASQVSQETVDLIVRGLKEGYGEKLFTLYAPPQPFSADAPVEPEESALLSACREHGLACRGLHDRMIEDLLVGHVIDRGALKMAPGRGHFNSHGHELAADEIYKWLNSSAE